MQTPSTEILIRCDGSTRVGLGHVIRCLALAVELREKHGLVPAFAVQEEDIGAALIREKNFIPHVKPEKSAEALWLNDLIQRLQPRVIVLDIRTDLDARALQNWRNAGKTVVVIDDPSDRRQAADLAFYPPVPQMGKADWSRFTGQAFIGWDYLLLRSEFSIKWTPPQNRMPSILITMGGSDPGGLTLLALRALCQVKEPFCARVVLGRAFLHNLALEQLRRSLPNNFEFLRDVSDMPSLMAVSDLAIASFGGTAYELAALNVPAVLLGLTEDHAQSAKALANAGMAISLGDYRHLSKTRLAETVQTLLVNPDQRRAMREACSAVDGKGAKRIANHLVNSLAAPKQMESTPRPY